MASCRTKRIKSEVEDLAIATAYEVGIVIEAVYY